MRDLDLSAELEASNPAADDDASDSIKPSGNFSTVRPVRTGA